MQGLAQSSIHGKAAKKTSGTRAVTGSNAGSNAGIVGNGLRKDGTRGFAGKSSRKSAGDKPSGPYKPRSVPTHVVPVDADGVPLPKLGWREAIVATVSGLGYELVDVERGQRGLLQVFIDRTPDRDYPVPGEFVTVEDCEQVTRQLQYALEVEGLEYARLEVSSPGLDRPLRTDADFLRFVGEQVQVHLKVPFQGRKVYSGVLGRDGHTDQASEQVAAWSLLFKDSKSQEQVLGFKLEEVREARLVPVVDFKGRKTQGANTSAGGQASAASDVVAEPGVDGGEGSQ